MTIAAGRADRNDNSTWVKKKVDPRLKSRVTGATLLLDCHQVRAADPTASLSVMLEAGWARDWLLLSHVEQSLSADAVLQNSSGTTRPHVDEAVRSRPIAILPVTGICERPGNRERVIMTEGFAWSSHRQNERCTARTMTSEWSPTPMLYHSQPLQLHKLKETLLNSRRPRSLESPPCRADYMRSSARRSCAAREILSRCLDSGTGPGEQHGSQLVRTRFPLSKILFSFHPVSYCGITRKDWMSVKQSRHCRGG